MCKHPKMLVIQSTDSGELNINRHHIFQFSIEIYFSFFCLLHHYVQICGSISYNPSPTLQFMIITSQNGKNSRRISVHGTTSFLIQPKQVTLMGKGMIKNNKRHAKKKRKEKSSLLTWAGGGHDVLLLTCVWPSCSAHKQRMTNFLTDQRGES